MRLFASSESLNILDIFHTWSQHDLTSGRATTQNPNANRKVVVENQIRQILQEDSPRQMGGWKVYQSMNILHLFQERQEDEAERDEAALKTRISADDGGDASNILRLPLSKSVPFAYFDLVFFKTHLVQRCVRFVISIISR